MIGIDTIRVVPVSQGQRLKIGSHQRGSRPPGGGDFLHSGVLLAREEYQVASSQATVYPRIVRACPCASWNSVIVGPCRGNVS